MTHATESFLRARRFSVAPMMALTDRHARVLLRLITSRALLYTEMLCCDALLHGDAQKLLGFDASEHPLALQLGGSDPDKLARCVQMAAEAGFDEVNLNVGCPSDRVQSGRFGACLMREPQLVAECFDAMAKASSLPATIKCRLGVDDQQAEESLPLFIDVLKHAGCKVFVVHARKAWLKGLSPKQNRDVPPLDYALVHAMKQRYPELQFVLNGGLDCPAAARSHLDRLDGVMLGRTAYYDPYSLAQVDKLYFDDPRAIPGRKDILLAYRSYVCQQLELGVPLNQMARHLLALYHGVPGARAFRRHLSEHMHARGAGAEVLDQALRFVEQQAA